MAETFKLHNRGGRRPGAGRPKGTTKPDGMITRTVRVSCELEPEKYQNLPSLLNLLYSYEELLLAQREAGQTTRTWDKFEQFLEEAKTLGY